MQKIIDIVLLDIEGCLTRKKGMPINLAPLLTLQQANSRTPLVLCTGRPQPYAEVVIQMLGEAAFRSPSIVENGCFLYYPTADTLVPHPLITREVRDLFRAIRPVLEPLASIEPGKELCISLTPPPGTDVRDLFKQVCAAKLSRELFSIAHSNSAVDITPKGINKGVGATFLCDSLGIDPQNVLAVGDSNNDMQVLEMVGHPACPENSTPEVKRLVEQKGGYVAERPYAAGVVEILQHYRII